ncbi:MAG: hypothetical protein J6386_10720 [Candidatus Synoicihabitans palmerolidicus]|nr:hypothetical protein [Candidatus Synoicihabitans palmerolidicus]
MVWKFNWCERAAEVGPDEPPGLSALERMITSGRVRGHAMLVESTVVGYAWAQHVGGGIWRRGAR